MDPDDTRVGVLIADDDDRFRMVVSALLSGHDDIHLLGEAACGREAVRQAQELVPDLVMLDVRMPDMDGLEAAGVIHRVLPTTKIVMLTVSDEEEDVYEALKAGASGYLLKENIMNDLAGAVRAVAQGLGLLLAPAIATKVLNELRNPPRGTNALTQREIEVLRLISFGYPNQQIAEELCLSSHTVKRHVANILSKLQQRSRLDAVLHAIRTGVLTTT